MNNEFTWNDRLHVDVGLRYEHEEMTAGNGNSSSLPIPAGVTGVLQTNPNAFNGTYAYSSGHETPIHWTAGVNYTLSRNLSVYSRFERAYETQGVNPASAVILYEAGLTFADYGFIGTVRPSAPSSTTILGEAESTRPTRT